MKLPALLKKLVSSISIFCYLYVFLPIPSYADHIPFIVLKAPISAGAVIDADKLDKKYFYIKPEAAARYVLNIAQIEGKIAKRVLLPGRAILLSSLSEPKVVVRGKTTRMLFQTGDLTITALGVPVDDGSVGDWVKLRNVDSGRLVSGVVLADGTVRVGMQ